jgi:hypothetical protein
MARVWRSGGRGSATIDRVDELLNLRDAPSTPAAITACVRRRARMVADQNGGRAGWSVAVPTCTVCGSLVEVISRGQARSSPLVPR